MDISVSKEAAVEIIEGHLNNFRDALFTLSSGVLGSDSAQLYVQSRRFFFREDGGFAQLADMVQISASAVRDQLRREETVCLTEAHLDSVNFAQWLAR